MTEVDMTRGNILKHIALFAFPLILGNLFQQLYNTVDTWVVGNYVGKVSFSAVGTVAPVINTLIGFFSGFSSGAGVVISREFGARNYEGVKKTVHTYVGVTLIFCIIFTILGFFCVPLMINILKSPAEVAVEQGIYLRIIFLGISGLMIYNMGSAILRAVGNSTIPFVFLAVGTVLNIGLDLLFVIVFKMGTEGVAYATIVSQFISAILVVITLLKIDSVVKVSVKEIKIDRGLLGDIFRIGFPIGLQMSVTAFSNVFVQSYVNYFGTDAMGGWTAYTKIDQLYFLPLQSIDVAITTFVGQNLGNNDIRRSKQGIYRGMILSYLSCIILITPTLIFAPSIVGWFIDNSETEVIRYGAMFLRLNSPFFLISCLNHCYSSGLKGCGKTGIVMFVTLGSFVLFRQIYLFIMANFISNTAPAIALGYPAGWVLCSLIMAIAYFKYFPKEDRKNK